MNLNNWLKLKLSNIQLAFTTLKHFETTYIFENITTWSKITHLEKRIGFLINLEHSNRIFAVKWYHFNLIFPRNLKKGMPTGKSLNPTNHPLPKNLHPWRLTWNIIMEVWKIIFLSKLVIFRFHVNLPGCISTETEVQNSKDESLKNTQSGCI